METTDTAKTGKLRSGNPRGEHDTVSEVILESAKNYPDQQIAYLTTEGQHASTYSDTYEEASTILAGLKGRGVNPGDIVVAALDEPNEFIPCIWACILGGVILCPISPRVTDMALWTEHLAYLSKLFNDPVYVTNNTNRELFEGRTVFTIEQLLKTSGREMKIQPKSGNKN